MAKQTQKQPTNPFHPGEILLEEFLVPGDLTVAQFTFVVRKRIKLNEVQALWLFVEGHKNGKRFEIFPPATSTMAAIYEAYKDEDLFLYITYKEENSTGDM